MIIYAASRPQNRYLRQQMGNCSFVLYCFVVLFVVCNTACSAPSTRLLLSKNNLLSNSILTLKGNSGTFLHPTYFTKSLCLPEFDSFRDRFKPCLENVCFLFLNQAPVRERQLCARFSYHFEPLTSQCLCIRFVVHNFRSCNDQGWETNALSLQQSKENISSA